MGFARRLSHRFRNASTILRRLTGARHIERHLCNLHPLRGDLFSRSSMVSSQAHIALYNPPREANEDVNLLRLLVGQFVPRGGPQVVQRVV